MAQDLDTAFSINGAEDCRRVYADWAASYDSGFATDMQYLLPAHVAGAFVAAGGQGPVLDVGAGTGLLAEHLRAMGFQGDIDAADLSPEMLAQAVQKGIYRALHQVDITQPIPIAGGYRGIVSSGTFTHGHVGPVALPHLLALAAPQAVVVLSINAGVYAKLGFDRVLADLQGIAGLTLLDVEIYGAAARAVDPAHAGDHAMIAVFRRV